ncbi:MAG: hypothetical protein M0R51_16045, partial [Clostridia bacterium]|nr:hypothetical protein [Clostridia bacterium]
MKKEDFIKALRDLADLVEDQPVIPDRAAAYDEFRVFYNKVHLKQRKVRKLVPIMEEGTAKL